MTDLEYMYTRNGTCSAYYRRKGSKERHPQFVIMEGQRRQTEKGQVVDYGVYTCSRDGEPDSPCNMGAFGMIEWPPGDTATDAGIRIWLARRADADAR